MLWSLKKPPEESFSIYSFLFAIQYLLHYISWTFSLSTSLIQQCNQIEITKRETFLFFLTSSVPNPNSYFFNPNSYRKMEEKENKEWDAFLPLSMHDGHG